MPGRDLAALALHTKPRLSYDVGAVVFSRTLAPFTSPAWRTSAVTQMHQSAFVPAAGAHTTLLSAEGRLCTRLFEC